MLNSKFDLYKREWLDLVFTGRNKNYGAYDLRVHYDNYLLRAMAFTVGALITGSILLNVLHKPQDQTKYKNTIFDTHPYVQPPTPKKPDVIHENIKKPSAPLKPIVHVPTQQFTVPKVTNDEVKQDKFTPQPQLLNPGLTTTPGDGKPQTTIIDTEQGTDKGTPGGDDPAPSNDPVDASGVDVMPEPTGGMAAWAKFLQKNIHYPDTDMEGRVYLSFVVEKDGHLSNITIIRGVSTLLDEEAMRVLKIAPAWKPGKQKGQAVRVKYILPIVFQVSQ